MWIWFKWKELCKIRVDGMLLWGGHGSGIGQENNFRKWWDTTVVICHNWDKALDWIIGWDSLAHECMRDWFVGGGSFFVNLHNVLLLFCFQCMLQRAKRRLKGFKNTEKSWITTVNKNKLKINTQEIWLEVEYPGPLHSHRVS